MGGISVALLIFGTPLVVVASIWLLVVAFKQSILWGLACLFVPFASIVFIILHWDSAKRPFLFSIVGLVLVGAGVAVLDRDAAVRVVTAARPGSQAAPLPKALDAPPAVPSTTPLLPGTPQTQLAPTALPGPANPKAAEPAAADVPQQQAPVGTLPAPRPTDPPTHANVAVGDLAKHIGEPLRYQMKDGRTVVGTLRSVDNDTVKLERDMGLGVSAFRIPLADVDRVLKRLQ
jgi:hypothetical protein